MCGVDEDHRVGDAPDIFAALGLGLGVDVGRKKVGKELSDVVVDDAIDDFRQLHRDAGFTFRHRHGEEVTVRFVEAAVEVEEPHARWIAVAARRKDRCIDGVGDCLRPAQGAYNRWPKKASAAVVRADLRQRRDVVGEEADSVEDSVEEGKEGENVWVVLRMAEEEEGIGEELVDGEESQANQAVLARQRRHEHLEGFIGDGEVVRRELEEAGARAWRRAEYFSLRGQSTEPASSPTTSARRSCAWRRRLARTCRLRSRGRRDGQ